MRQVFNVSLLEAEKVLAAAASRASEIGAPQNIAVVDAAGHLVAFRRMDGAKFTSIDIAIAKAYTAAGVQKETLAVGPATLPGQHGFGIQHSNGGRFTTIPGGVPLLAGDTVVGAIGVSSGAAMQDHDVAHAGAAAFKPEN